jgi:sporulation protein YlmC with PRC-barrel domain
MNHYGTLRDYRFVEKDADDIRGSNVYGINDEKLGDIDDVIFDHNTGNIRYVVVKSGWLSSKKFIVPADRLQPSREHKNDYQVNLTKQQIENFPPYEESSVSDSERWQKYEKDYDKVMTTDGGVMHRADSPDRIITPPSSEVISSGRTPEPQSSIPSAMSAAGSSSRTHLGQRWSNFEDRVRRDRTHIVSTCNVCGVSPQPASKIDRDRKVS